MLCKLGGAVVPTVSEVVLIAGSANRAQRSVKPVLRSDPSVQLVDVRSREEWLKGYLPGAGSMPLLRLESTARDIDSSRRSLVYRHKGYRATTAASVLLQKSAGEIGILIDGVEEWSALGSPPEAP